MNDFIVLTGIMATLLGIIATWNIYRNSILSKRRNHIAALDALLPIYSNWFDAAYTKESSDENWKNPDFIVNKVDVDVIKNIISESGIIFSQSFIGELSRFVQLALTFNQLVELHLTFTSGNYSDIKIAEKKALKVKMEGLAKHIHVAGIGKGFYEGSDFPYLNECFKKLKEEFNREKKKKTSPLCWNGLKFGDFVFYTIPIAMIITVFIRFFFL